MKKLDERAMENFAMEESDCQFQTHYQSLHAKSRATRDYVFLM